jgi:hypothetical protein
VSHTVNSESEHGTSSREADLDEAVAPSDEGALRVEREGLPPGYRMRADKHYVDLMAAHSTDQPVRMIAIGQIDGGSAVASADLRPLIESIRSCGIVHPLIVRRRNGRYVVVAGQKRLSAANILRLPTVPCLVHELDDAQALALATADNLAVRLDDRVADASSFPAAIRDIVAHHLATIRTCADLVSNGPPVLTRSVFDLIRAHSWRAARLVDAIGLITNAPVPQGRERPISALADDVIRGFEPEGRLNGFTIQAQIRDDLSSSGLNDHELLTGLSGAILSVLPLIEAAVRPTLLIKGRAAGQGSIVLEVSQPDVPVSASVARHFFDDETSNGRAGGYAALAGARAAKALATRYAGSTGFEVAAHGSTLKMVLVRRS